MESGMSGVKLWGVWLVWGELNESGVGECG